ncbi:MAG TPA: hypothetical protein VGG26_06160 [Terracidiphilus sp.]|jgi:hypothetical protein
MKTSDARQDLEVRAAAALKAVLAEVSTIKVKEIRHESPERALVAYVDVFGHRHTLACDVQTDGQAGQVRSALEELRKGAGRDAGDTMPVIIAPYLSPEAQQLCKENKAGFLDLEGNARLALGEVFIVKRTLPHREQHRSTAVWPIARSTPEKFTPASAPIRPTPSRRAEA